MSKNPTILGPRYYNLYVEYNNVGDNKRRNIAYTALTVSEIEKYFQYVEKNKLGLQPIVSNVQITVVEPIAFYIYNLSKAPDDNRYGRVDIEELVRKNLSDKQDYRTAYRKLGDEVTNTFDIDLEKVLDRMREASTPEFMKNVVANTDWSQNEDQNQEHEPNTSYNVSWDEGTSDNSWLSDRKTEKKELSELEGKKTTSEENSYKSGELNDEPIIFYPKEYSGGITDNSAEPSFHVEKIAKVIAKHLGDLKEENGQMVGVFGKWGRGKTFLVNEVCKKLNIDFHNETSSLDSKFIFAKFQAWKYQNTPALWAYLYEILSKSYFTNDFLTRKKRAFQLNLIRNGQWETWVLPLIIFVSGIIWFFCIDFDTKVDFFNVLIQWAGGVTAFVFLLYRLTAFYRFSNKPAKNLLKSFTKIPSFEYVLGPQAEIHREIISLIKAWDKDLKDKKLLLFIDDLDRCSEERMLEIIDALRVMLDDKEINKKLVVLVAVDDLKLKKAVEYKYKEIYRGNELISLTSEYLDKLFISSIKLPPISSDYKNIFIQSLAKVVNKEVGNTEPSLNKEKSPIQLKKNESKKENSLETMEKEPESTANKDDIKEDSEPTIFTSGLSKEEIDFLKIKIQSVNKDLTPRQIRIIFYRYLLARNLWLERFEGLNFYSDRAIDEILSLMYSKSKKDYDDFEGLNEIVKMVVTY